MLFGAAALSLDILLFQIAVNELLTMRCWRPDRSDTGSSAHFVRPGYDFEYPIIIEYIVHVTLGPDSGFNLATVLRYIGLTYRFSMPDYTPTVHRQIPERMKRTEDCGPLSFCLINYSKGVLLKLVGW